MAGPVPAAGSWWQKMGSPVSAAVRPVARRSLVIRGVSPAEETPDLRMPGRVSVPEMPSRHSPSSRSYISSSSRMASQGSS